MSGSRARWRVDLRLLQLDQRALIWSWLASSLRRWSDAVRPRLSRRSCSSAEHLSTTQPTLSRSPSILRLCCADLSGGHCIILLFRMPSCPYRVCLSLLPLLTTLTVHLISRRPAARLRHKGFLHLLVIVILAPSCTQTHIILVLRSLYTLFLLHSHHHRVDGISWCSWCSFQLLTHSVTASPPCSCRRRVRLLQLFSLCFLATLEVEHFVLSVVLGLLFVGASPEAFYV